MKGRRWLLPLLLMIILVPVLSALVFSGWGLYRQRLAMASVAQRYAQSLARGIVQEENAPSAESPLRRHRRMELFLKMLTVGPPVPGWIAVTGPGGIKIQGSPGSRVTPELAAEVREALAAGEMRALTLKSDKHPPSAAAVCPYPDGVRAVIVVISHYLVPGQMMKIAMFQPVVSIAVSAVALVGIFLLWRWCVLPLRTLASRVERLQWGRDVLSAPPPGPLPELRQMQGALAELSAGAVEREALKRNYVSDIVRTQEEERGRLAREIHDSPLQTVAALVQRIQLARRGLCRPGIDRERVIAHLDAASEAALNAVQDMRDVCDQLAPPWTSLGAVRAFEELAARLSRSFGVAVNASVEGAADGLDEKTVLTLCRIVQEAAANAVRHGHATSVDVKLTCGDGTASLSVCDNGDGIGRAIDPELLRVRGHRGIAGMNERAAQAGGTFSIGPREGGGTSVRVTVPAGARKTLTTPARA